MQSLSSCSAVIRVRVCSVTRRRFLFGDLGKFAMINSAVGYFLDTASRRHLLGHHGGDVDSVSGGARGGSGTL